MPRKTSLPVPLAFCLGFVHLAVLTGCSSALRIRDRPIPFSSARQQAARTTSSRNSSDFFRMQITLQYLDEQLA